MSNLEARKLKEIKEYADLLTAKDSANVVAEAVTAIVNAAATPAEGAVAAAAATVVGSISVAVNGSITSRDFNVYLAKYIGKNIATIAPDVIAFMDAEIASNLTEANSEASDLGLTSAPLTPTPAPSFSPTTDMAMATVGSSFTYNASTKASNMSGWDITMAAYGATGMPAWATLDPATGVITGEVPSDVTPGDTETIIVTATTNNGIAPTPLTLTVTYA